MRRMLSVAMTLLLVFSFAGGLHQTSRAAQSTTASQAIPVTDAAGEPWIEISIDSFTADFTGYDRNYAPDRGFQYAHITVTITNTGTTPFVPSPYGFTLIDTDGFISDTAFVMVDETKAPPLLESDVIEPGDSVTGSVLFQMLAGTEAAAIAYAATYDRMTFLATNGESPAIGDTVAVLGPDAQPIANVTVDEWLDPLPDVDPSSSPERGHHFAGAVVTIENVADGTMTVDPWSFVLIDSDGYQANGSNPYRPEPEIEDLGYIDLEAGDSVSGVVGFQVFNTATPTFIAFKTNDQFAFVAAFDDAPAVPDLNSLPEVSAPVAGSDDAADDENATDDEEADDEQASTDDAVSEESSEECQAASVWMEDFYNQVATEEASGFSFEDAADMSAEELQAVRDDLQGILEDFEAAEPPALVVDLVDAYTNILEYAIDSLDDLIEAAENGEDLEPLIEEIIDNDVSFDAYLDQYDLFLEACPGEE